MHELMDLTEQLQLPPIHITKTCNVVPALEGLALLCAHFQSSGNMYDLTEKYNHLQGAILQIVNNVSAIIDRQWSKQLLNFNMNLINCENLAQWVAAVHCAGALLPTIWGFIDCMVCRICQPMYRQRMAYNSYKKYHTLKYQAVVVPCGLIAHLFGPWEGHQTDTHLLAVSGLQDNCCWHALCPGANEATPLEDCHFQLYGDAAYGVSPILQSPFIGRQTDEQQAWNSAMSKVRIKVEHAFGIVLQSWPFLCCWWKHAVYSSPCGLYFCVATILTNLQGCLHGNQVASQFQCDPPTVDKYLA